MIPPLPLALFHVLASPAVASSIGCGSPISPSIALSRVSFCFLVLSSVPVELDSSSPLVKAFLVTPSSSSKNSSCSVSWVGVASNPRSCCTCLCASVVSPLTAAPYAESKSCCSCSCFADSLRSSRSWSARICRTWRCNSLKSSFAASCDASSRCKSNASCSCSTVIGSGVGTPSVETGTPILSVISAAVICGPNTPNKPCCPDAVAPMLPSGTSYSGVSIGIGPASPTVVTSAASTPFGLSKSTWSVPARSNRPGILATLPIGPPIPKPAANELIKR